MSIVKSAILDKISTAVFCTKFCISDSDDDSSHALAMSSKSACMYCGSKKRHDWKACKLKLALDTCGNCFEKGHWSPACTKLKRKNQKSKKKLDNSYANAVVCAMHNTASSCLSHSLVDCYIKGKCMNTIVDTGASRNYIDAAATRSLQLKVKPCSLEVGFAQASLKQKALGVVTVDINLNGRIHRDVELLF